MGKTNISAAISAALPLPLAGEGWGEGNTLPKTPKSPHPALRADLSRKRESEETAAYKAVG